MIDENKISEDEYTKLYLARQPIEKTEILKKACVGIAGAGGLGSVVAENLARAGVGRLIIADFDKVEPSNLNRQRFTLDQVGMPKAEALARNIKMFNPFTEIVEVNEKVTASNCKNIFQNCNALAECFDGADQKAMLVSEIRKQSPDICLVAVSGIAGTNSGAEICIRKLSDRLYVVGDMKSDAEKGEGLFATRVGIAASMQSHHILRLILGEEK